MVSWISLQISPRRGYHYPQLILVMFSIYTLVFKQFCASYHQGNWTTSTKQYSFSPKKYTTGKEFATEFQQAKVLKKLLKNIEKLLKNTEIMP